MSYKTPQAITVAASTTGATKAALSPAKALVSGFLAGAYIAFGGLVAIAVSSGLDPKTWGTLPTLFTGAVFTVGLILVVIAGAELLTGNMALVPLAVMRRQAAAPVATPVQMKIGPRNSRLRAHTGTAVPASSTPV